MAALYGDEDPADWRPPAPEPPHVYENIRLFTERVRDALGPLARKAPVYPCVGLLATEFASTTKDLQGDAERFLARVAARALPAGSETCITVGRVQMVNDEDFTVCVALSAWMP
jgi:hypothetical protein